MATQWIVLYRSFINNNKHVLRTPQSIVVLLFREQRVYLHTCYKVWCIRAVTIYIIKQWNNIRIINSHAIEVGRTEWWNQVPVAQLVRARCLYSKRYTWWIHFHKCNGEVAGSSPAGNTRE